MIITLQKKTRVLRLGFTEGKLALNFIKCMTHYIYSCSRVLIGSIDIIEELVEPISHKLNNNSRVFRQLLFCLSGCSLLVIVKELGSRT